MRRWCAIVVIGLFVGVAVPYAAGVPSAPKAKAERNVKKARKKKSKPKSAGSVEINTPQSLRLAIDDLTKTFGAKYPKGEEYRKRLGELEARPAADGPSARADLQTLAREALLANPLLNFDRLIVRRAAGLGLPANWQSNASLGKARYDNEIATLSPVHPAGRLTTLYRPDRETDFVGDIDLHFDAEKMLFSRSGSDGWGVWEINIDGHGPRKLPLIDTKGVDNYDACYLSDDNIIFTSTAAVTGVPCVGGSSPVTNLFRLDTTDGAVRRLTFDQDHDWYPAVMNSGRVMYLRWEYGDISHAFSRILFSMNPDGTDQVAYYGSNSYWPNAMFYAREIPGAEGQFVAIVSGHHGLKRMGELVLFDTSKGRFEADGVVQRIPGRGRPVEPVILDNVAGRASPKFLHPWPLSDKYFLVAALVRGQSRWAIYLVDVFDNVTLVKDDPTHHLIEPVPLAKTPRPPVLPSHDSRLEAYPGNNFSVRIRGEMVNGPDQPVCRVSQTQAVAFCRWLGKTTGRQFTLPTEAQWEYACRAGTATPLNFGRPDADHSPHANLADATSTKVWHWVHPGGSTFNDKAFASANVGTYEPNRWGLHDMHGNVAEWTRSPYGRYPYRAKARVDPTEKAVVRGGSWNDRVENARSSFRMMYRPHERVYDVGFRVICRP